MKEVKILQPYYVNNQEYVYAAFTWAYREARV